MKVSDKRLPPRADVDRRKLDDAELFRVALAATDRTNEYDVRCLLHRYALVNDAVGRRRKHPWASARDNMRRRIVHFATTRIYIGMAP